VSPRQTFCIEIEFFRAQADQQDGILCNIRELAMRTWGNCRQGLRNRANFKIFWTNWAIT
jgi:hypothetical protein